MTELSKKFFTLREGVKWMGNNKIPKKMDSRPVFEVHHPYGGPYKYKPEEILFGVLVWCDPITAEALQIDIGMHDTEPAVSYFTFEQWEIQWLTRRQERKFKLRRAVAQL